jgi:HK97 gp10 family phage protein
VADFHARIHVDEAELGNQLALPMMKTAAKVTRRISAQAKMNAPVDTGNLARSIDEDPITFVTPFHIDTGVTAHANYARYVHEGTRPHIIRPRHAQALRFKIGSQVIFAASVRHPGTRARPFLRNAAIAVASTM